MRPAATLPATTQVARLLHKMVTVPLSAAVEHLGAGDRAAIPHLVAAARAIDRIYWRQRSEFGWQLKQALVSGECVVPPGVATLVDRGYGPWDVFDDDRPFWGEERRPAGGAMYPADMTRDEFDEYLTRHPGERTALLDPATVVRRDGNRLRATPYADVFRDDLQAAGSALSAAAAHVSDVAFARFLRMRAADLQTGALQRSEALWIDAGESPIDIAIGPFEVYDDGFLGTKRSYEATVLLRHPMTDQVAAFETFTPALSAALPGSVAPPEQRQRIVIGVYDVLFTAGSTNLGAKPVAAMLPTDKDVRRQYGSRLLLFRNVMSAKFAAILQSIARRILTEPQASHVTEDAFVIHTLLHETAHALVATEDTDAGPGGRLRERYSTIEECRADLIGLVFLEFLAGRGVLPAGMPADAAATFVAGLFRVLRFGAENDYGRAAAITLGHLAASGAVWSADDGRLALDATRVLGAVRELATRVQAIASTGSYDDAGALLKSLGQVPSWSGALLRGLDDLPIDVDFSVDSSLLR